MPKNMKTRKGKDGFNYPYTSPDLVIDKNGKSNTKKFEEISAQFKDIAKQIESGTATVPNNVVLFQDNDSTETTEDYIPLLSSNGTEYRLTINDNGVPVIKDSSNTIIFTCGTGSGGSSGGDTPTTPDKPGEVTSGTPYSINWIENKSTDSSTGSEVDSTDWCLSQYLSVSDIDYIKYISKMGYIRFNSFYDINKKFISYFTVNPGSNFIDIPENATYLRVSVQSSEKEKLSIIPFKNPIQSWKNGVQYNLNLTVDKYVNGDNFTDYTGWSMTDYLECFGVKEISVANNTKNTGYCAFYDQAKARLSSFNVTTDNPCKITVPQYACYFVISNETDIMNGITITPIV